MQRFILAIIGFIFTSTVSATLNVAIPEPLQPWKAWVLHNEKEIDCVSAYDNSQSHMCAWPSNLKLNLTALAGAFEFKLQNDTAAFIILPGNIENWPQNVKVNNQLAGVVQKNNLPALYLPAGRYAISGEFIWDQIPEILWIPTNMALVSLRVNDQEIAHIKRESNGQLWISAQQMTQETPKEDSLSIQVYRLFQDKIPMESQTLLRMRVTGQTKEVNLGKVLLDNQIPLSIKSTWPSQIDQNGELKSQVSSGVGEIMIASRLTDKVNKLTFAKRENWPQHEVWSFESKNDLRLVEIQGGQSIDPEQSAVPENWRQFPAYLMKPNQSLILVEKKRGQQLQRYEDLALYRKMWLDFSGQGLTIVDDLKGNLESSWRLSMRPPFKLGRVSIDDRDRLITTLNAKKEPGVEVRQGQLNLLGVSRVIKTLNLPAIGWDLDVKQLSIEFNFPPGWLLIDVLGPDSVTNAWLRDWSLLDFFLVFIISASAWKLLGLRWGLLVGLTLVLIYREPNAPVYSWLNLIAALALFQVLPKGKIENFISFYLKISFIFLVIIALPFMVQQVRVGIYPQLKGPTHYQPRYIAETLPAPRSLAEVATQSMGQSKAMLSENRTVTQKKAIENYEPNAKIQTGPGIPEWQWSVSMLNWVGPVLKDQNITIYMIPGWLNSILKFLQVFLMGLLMYGLALKWRGLTNDKSHPTTTAPLPHLGQALSCLLALSTLAFSFPKDAVAEFPNQKMLEDLKSRLLEPHACYPDCAQIAKMQLETQNDILTIRLNAQASIATAIPIPYSNTKWSPQTVQLDGVETVALQIDQRSQLWLRLEAGSHDIVLQGQIKDYDEIELNLPLKPHLILSQLNQWEVKGLNRQQAVGQIVYLKRLETTSPTSAQFVGKSSIPPFVNLDRVFNLGFDWEIINRLQRVTPLNTALQFSIPLIEGEQILSNNVQVKDGLVYVTLSENQNEIVWTSKLNKVSKLTLNAIKNNEIKEVWHLKATQEWHFDFAGVPMIHQQSSGSWYPTWEPWPGESLVILISRPEALPGNTLTIDNVGFSMAPGKRATDHTLETSIRSSQGTVHVFQMPEHTQIQDVLIDGLSQPINLIQRDLRIPIHPGLQQIMVKWQLPQGITSYYKSPQINLNIPHSNTRLSIGLNYDRWVLFLGGPLMGPAVLFWGILLVVLVVCLIIPRVVPEPLSRWQWFLLGAGSLIASPLAIILILAWFVAMNQRSKISIEFNNDYFKFIQVGLVLLTFLFIISLFAVVSKGLLGTPQMQISVPHLFFQPIQSLYATAIQLQWYQDLSSQALPNVWVISLPMYVYRIIMLLWALWLAFSLIQWLRWGWQKFSTHGFWNLNKTL